MKDKIPTYINIMLDTLSTNLKDADLYNEMHSLYWEQTIRHRNSKYVLIIDLYIKIQSRVIKADQVLRFVRFVVFKFTLVSLKVFPLILKFHQLIIPLSFNSGVLLRLDSPSNFLSILSSFCLKLLNSQLLSLTA